MNVFSVELCASLSTSLVYNVFTSFFAVLPPP